MPNSCWVYLRSEPAVWKVGFYAPDGAWHPDSDHASPDAAAERVRWLNGGPSVTAVTQAEAAFWHAHALLAPRMSWCVPVEGG